MPNNRSFGALLTGTASGDGHDWYDASLPSESQTAVVWLEGKHFQGSGQRSMVGAPCTTQGYGPVDF